MVQAYGPTSTSSDEEYENFLANVNEGLNYRQVRRVRLPEEYRFLLAIGDFNANVESGEDDEIFIGKHGLGHRNERD